MDSTEYHLVKSFVILTDRKASPPRDWNVEWLLDIFPELEMELVTFLFQ